MLELHIWAPAWGLPSIDPECIAAILYIQAAQPTEEWKVIPSSDPSLSPSNILPALNHNGVWTSGYTPILRYLTTQSLLSHDLDSSLRSDPKSRADLLAFTAQISQQLSPLLSLSLYVSSTNYTTTLRPLLSKILPFPLPWTIPQLMRAEAIARTEWMGLGELDKDFDKDGGGLLGGEGLTETFRRHVPRVEGKKGVKGQMTVEEEKAIRLFGVVEGAVDGLEEVLKRRGGGGEGKGERFFEGQEITSVDCLAFGYLSLMHDAPVPRAFLKDALTKKYPHVLAFLTSFREKHYPVNDPTTSLLPYIPTPKPSFTSFVFRLFDSTVRHIPNLGVYYANEMRLRLERGIRGLDRRFWTIVLGTVAVSGGVWYGYLTYKGMQPFGGRLMVWRRERGFGRFGEVGAMLGLGVPMMGAVNAGNGSASQGARVVDMDSDEVVG